MKRILILLFSVGLIYSSAEAGLMMASFQSIDFNKIQVVLDGKVLNETPKSFVKIKGHAGPHLLEVRVFSEDNCISSIFENITVFSSGFITSYTLGKPQDDCPTLIKTKFSRIYSDRWKRPDKFFNNGMVA